MNLQGRPPAAAVRRLAPLEDLPDELFLMVTGCLGPGSLALLDRVSRECHRIVENELYKLVNVLSSESANTDGGSVDNLYLANFLRTMLESPHLCEQVRSASIVISSVNIPEAIGLPYRATIPTPTVAPTYDVALPESQLARILLSSMSELKSLKLDTWNIVDNVYDEDGGLNVDYKDALYKIFEGKPILRQNPASVLGFSNLSILYWVSKSLPYSIVCLPTLDHLYISSGCDIKVPQQPVVIPKITKLSIFRNTTIFFEADEEHAAEIDDGVMDLLECCTSLTHFAIHLEEEDYPGTEALGEHASGEEVEGDLDDLVSRVHEVRPELESFVFRVAKQRGNDFLDYVTLEETPLFSPFDGLKHIRIPCDQLLTSYNGTEPPQSIAKLLPWSLENLEIDFPSQEIFGFLDKLLAAHVEDVPNLSKLTVYLGSPASERGVMHSRGNGRTSQLNRWRSKPVVERFWADDVELRFTDMEDEDPWRVC